MGLLEVPLNYFCYDAVLRTQRRTDQSYRIKRPLYLYTLWLFSASGSVARMVCLSCTDYLQNMAKGVVGKSENDHTDAIADPTLPVCLQ